MLLSVYLQVSGLQIKRNVLSAFFEFFFRMTQSLMNFVLVPRFRDNCDEMLRVLARHGVPTLIFSAGIGDVIEELVGLTALSSATNTAALPVAMLNGNPNETIAREFPLVKIVSNFMGKFSHCCRNFR